MSKVFKAEDGSKLIIFKHGRDISIDGMVFTPEKAAEIAAEIGILAIRQSEKNFGK